MKVLLSKGAKLPVQSTAGSAGYDIHALASGELQAGERQIVGTGVHLQLPPGMAAMVCPRSGLAANNGITVLNSPGIIDSDYRGEVCVIMHNTSQSKAYKFDAGDRIAQLVFVRAEALILEEACDLNSTERGAGGFGSTGR